MGAGAARSWRSADYPSQVPVLRYAGPYDCDGESIAWSAGVLWDMCPAWHARFSPYTRAAARLLSTLGGMRADIGDKPEWTEAGHAIAVRTVRLREYLQADYERREFEKRKKKGGE